MGRKRVRRRCRPCRVVGQPGAEVNPSGGIETADVAVRVAGLRSGRSPERGSASRDVGRRRVASTPVRHRRARRSLFHRPFPKRSPGQWPDLLVVTVARKIACLFVLYLAVLSW